MNTYFESAQVSLLDAHHLPDHSAVNHPLPPGHRFNTLPLSVTGFRSLSERSGLHLCTAGSSRTAGRITFVILRTDRSPPVAPHPVSRRRSYLWLQAGERLPGEDLHLSDGVRSQAHGTLRFQRGPVQRQTIGSKPGVLEALRAQGLFSLPIRIAKWQRFEPTRWRHDGDRQSLLVEWRCGTLHRSLSRITVDAIFR